MWTYEDIEGLAENITVRKHYKDDELGLIEIIAHEGYAIHSVGNDAYYSHNAYIPSLEDMSMFEAVSKYAHIS